MNNVILELETETVRRTGGITGAGAGKLLGAPRLHPLEVLVREAVQNSWDAVEEDTVTFGLRAYEFDGAGASQLGAMFSKGTSGPEPLFRLPDGSIDGLLIWDRGTSGLGGPIRADIVGGGDPDFIRFVYNIGDTKERSENVAKGGTYGFGRSAFLNASRIGTVLIYTVCKHNNNEERFIGMTWGSPSTDDTKRTTGRHWWGDTDPSSGQNCVAPLIGSAARDLATSLGMNRLGPGETGTAVLVLAPRWNREQSVTEGAQPRARSAACERIRAGLLWNCWPRISDQSLNIEMDWFGAKIDFANLRSERRLRPFIDAYHSAVKNDNNRLVLVKALETQRPRRDLGDLAVMVHPFVAQQTEVSDDDEISSERRSNTPLQHIALMRATRLVIKYHVGPVPQGGTGYAGVFLAAPDADAIYAKSEPPTHDDWIPDNVGGEDRIIVSQTRRRIDEALRAAIGGPVDDAANSIDGSQDFGLLADKLGAFLVGMAGEGAGSGRSRGSGGRSGGRSSGNGVRLQILDPERLVHENGVKLIIPIEITSNIKQKIILKANIKVLVNNGIEVDPPNGSSHPRVLGWKTQSEDFNNCEESVEIDIINTYKCHVCIFQPTDCMVTLDIGAEVV